jgi:predicted ATPase
LGYGVSQGLPVLAQCSFAPRGATLLFEQPELHLHQGAAHRLASVFVSAAKQKTCALCRKRTRANSSTKFFANSELVPFL